MSLSRKGAGLGSPSSFTKGPGSRTEPAAGSTALPRLGAASSSKRFSLVESMARLQAQQPADAIPALLTKALEESRAQVHALARERAAAADKAAQILEALGQGASQPGSSDSTAATAGELGFLSEPAGGDTPLDRVHSRVRQLQEQLASKEVEAVEARLRHESAATAVVLGEEELERREAALGLLRHTVHELEEARHALQVKVGLLESQAAEQAASARRHLEEQTCSFKGEAAMARAFQEKHASSERLLEAARRALHEERERSVGLAAQCGLLGAALAEAQAKAVSGEKKLWEATSSLTDIEGEHRALIERNKALVAANRELQGAVADHKERALQADALKQALEVQQAAGAALQAALQEEASRLAEELQQEREQRQRAEQELREASAAAQSLGAATRGREDEIASLLAKLDEYSDRLVRLGEEAAAATAQAAAAGEQQRAAEERSERAWRENASLRDSLAEMAAAERRLKEQLEERQGQLSECQTSLKQQEFCNRQLDGKQAQQEEHIQLMQATLAEQAQQLEALASSRAQCEEQQEGLQVLGAQLRECEERCGQLRQALLEVTGAKEQADKLAYKLEVINKRLKEQHTELNSKLKATQHELSEAQGTVIDLQEKVLANKQAFEAQHAAVMEEQKQVLCRNEELEHTAKQQSELIADLDAQRACLLAQYQAAQQRCTHLQRLGGAYSQAYGRLAAHTGELHAQFARQLGSLLHLCRHMGLQLEPVCCTADPVAVAGQEGCSASSEEGCDTMAAGPPASPKRWVAVVRLLNSLRTELGIAAQLLEAQSSSAQAALLATVPAGIAAALSLDLQGMPAEVAAQLEPALGAVDSRSGASSRQAAEPPGDGSLEPSTTPPPPAAAAALVAEAPASVAQTAPSLEQDRQALQTGAAQVAQMEAQLDRLMHDNLVLASKAAAAAGLHEQELAARQHAQELVTLLRGQLQSTRAERDAFKGQRDLHMQLSKELSRKLKEAAYTVRRLQAEAEGPVLSLAHRGLLDRGVQTQHCELWLRNAGGGPLCGGRVCTSSGSSAGSGPGSAAAAAAAAVAAEDGQAVSSDACPLPTPLSLHETQLTIQEIYRSKAASDIAVARGQRPFSTLPAFVEAHFQLQHGAGSERGAARLRQLAAGVQRHAAAAREVALFGLAAGMLCEEELAALQQEAAGAAVGAEGGPAPALHWLDTAQRAPRPSSCGAASPQQLAAKAPLALYHSRRRSAAQVQDATWASLAAFSHSAWHAAYLRSAARQLAPAPNPLGLLHCVCWDVQDLLLSVPGVAELLQWVAGGGVAGCLRGMDLGMPMAEDQVPQLYLLAVDACRLLGLPTTPRLYVRNSPEAAAYYLQAPANPAFHSLNGSLTPEFAAAAVQQRGNGLGMPGGAKPQRQGSAAAGPAAPAGQGEAGPGWECVLVLTSGLVDLLEPAELQAVMAGCLGFHLALTSKAVDSLQTTAAAGTAAAVGGSGGGDAERQRALCRGLGAMHTLGALCVLCPEAVAARLPPQLAPLFAPRIQPVLLRALRYLAFFGDRFSLAASGDVRTVASALAKLGSGSATLRNELNLDAILQQAQALDEAAAQVLPAALRHEGGATLGAASASLTILRVWHLLRCGGDEREGGYS